MRFSLCILLTAFRLFSILGFSGRRANRALASRVAAAGSSPGVSSGPMPVSITAEGEALAPLTLPGS